eukprot:scaffold18138_cov128-Cylindrotheca_fusiformis.AAC.12
MAAPLVVVGARVDGTVAIGVGMEDAIDVGFVLGSNVVGSEDGSEEMIAAGIVGAIVIRVGLAVGDIEPAAVGGVNMANVGFELGPSDGTVETKVGSDDGIVEVTTVAMVGAAVISVGFSLASAPAVGERDVSAGSSVGTFEPVAVEYVLGVADETIVGDAVVKVGIELGASVFSFIVSDFVGETVGPSDDVGRFVGAICVACIVGANVAGLLRVGSTVGTRVGLSVELLRVGMDGAIVARESSEAIPSSDREAGSAGLCVGFGLRFADDRETSLWLWDILVGRVLPLDEDAVVLEAD